jgi:hypothetical protein
MAKMLRQGPKAFSDFGEVGGFDHLSVRFGRVVKLTRRNLRPTRLFRVTPSAMVHLRLNESESNPNPHVNFITALPRPDSSETESARQLLRALAAQVRPVMKSHGFVVNSLEEVPHSLFSGQLPTH